MIRNLSLLPSVFIFLQRSQSPGKSVGDYSSNLRQLANHCEFRYFLQEALRNCLVCGMQSEHIQKVLLMKANLTLEQALEISQGMEAATLQSKELKEKPCGCCRNETHSKEVCKFHNATCQKCGKVGHIAPACRSKVAEMLQE